MSGAIRNYSYRSDNGLDYTIRLDRTNAKATTIGYGLPCCYDSIGNARLPQGIIPRYVLTYNRDNPKMKRKFIFGNILIWDWSYKNSYGVVCEDYPGQDDAAGITRAWIITSRHGEQSFGIPNTITPGGGLTN